MSLDGMAQTERARLNLARPDLLRERALIGGEWIDSAERIRVTNPATRGVLGHIPNLGADAAQKAVSTAAAAASAWRARSAKERSVVLRRWFELISAHKEDLSRLMTAEQGKPLAEARAEIGYAAAFVEWFAEEAKRAYGDIIPGHARNVRISVEKRPVGVVAAVTPWNFPAAMITRKVAPALAAGCTIVLKPSELTPFTALALGVLAVEAGVPGGAFNIVTGAPSPIGEVFVSDPRIAKFTFTGSTPVGKALAARCMDTVKRVSLELGGNAPFIVFDDADIDRAVAGALASKFRNTGQTCVCANRFLVQASVFDAFAEALAKRASTLRVGDGLAGETDQGPLIDQRAVEKVDSHVRDALKGGATLLTGGRAHAAGSQFYQPTVLTHVDPNALLCREETFGPVAGLVRFETEAEAIALANGSRAGLASYAFTSNFDRAARVTEALEFGMVGLNTGLISTEVAPFGGCKESGIGREGSRYGLSEFQDLKTVCAEVSVSVN
jgi:succinate-semialdehyde dehydrogenase/glutarate-semialdehyde dehydrogenase